jgi:hypothetical protein
VHLNILVTETVYSGCALAFILLIVLMIMHGRTRNTGVAILACCFASVAWAAANAVSSDLSIAIPTILDSIRLSAWLLFAVVIVTIRAGDGSGLGRAYLFGALVYCLFAIAKDAWVLFLNPYAAGLDTTQLLLRIGLGVGGLLTIENLWRNTEPTRRWHLWPLCLAIGGVFAYELFLFSDAFITRGRVDPGLALGRALVAGFMTPLLALAMARNREWRIDIHVSRQVVLHTATLGASGCFLLAVAVVGMVLRGFGGDWGLVLQLAMLFGSIVVLGTVLTSGNIRRRLKFLISRNFFTHRYDTGAYVVAIDPDRLRSALTHLVQNAIDASPPRSRVIISSRRLGTRVLIDITDKGPGMDEAFIRDELMLSEGKPSRLPSSI